MHPNHALKVSVLIRLDSPLVFQHDIQLIGGGGGGVVCVCVWGWGG